ncbi:TetR/AcrR family transcriptional regulator [Arthrobacter sp. CAU 1506]|uniref:TetR/AcrR family transcriptional regulator n=1 Tax=Arthrobacter sp. CAU 1506 TaxID=2560052 RepID=UPI0010AD4C5E|nr:TetR/AcrR family transcriptional regulator [Arthrobacter sp. CAU 1506]TJY66239.1 TetR/AcrR family transcriptional regulator [Arthrobacter sp. CAU 1506]
MPRLVDHAERRRSIIETTWRLIADSGIENVNMRDIAKECGYAGPGVLSHYFPNKDALLLASYQLICDRTNERIDASTHGRRGLDALRSLCLEIIPADPLTVTEARVAVAFWQRAQTAGDLRAVGRQALQAWRDRMLRFVAEAEHDGSYRSPERADDFVDGLLNFMMGLHITSMLDAHSMSGSRQRTLIEQALQRLALPEATSAQ